MMSGLYCLWWKRYKWYVIVFFSMLFLFVPSDLLQAKSVDLPAKVQVVKNERCMIRMMVKGMRKHQSQFSFYYPGIYTKFRRYERESKAYATFFDKLSQKDGYVAGTVSGYCIMIRGNKTRYVTFQFGYLTTKKQERRIDKQVKKIVKRIGRGSSAVRAKKAHDYLIRNMKYDTRYYSPYDAFSKGRGICMSYALAYQRLLQEMKIPCVYVEGKNHAWNLVKIGKYWYNVDVTWNDSKNGTYRYFLKSDSDFPGHKRPAARWYSKLKMARYSYNLSTIP